MHHTDNWENIKNIDNALHFGFQKYEPSKYKFIIPREWTFFPTPLSIKWFSFPHNIILLMMNLIFFLWEDIINREIIHIVTALYWSLLIFYVFCQIFSLYLQLMLYHKKVSHVIKSQELVFNVHIASQYVHVYNTVHIIIAHFYWLWYISINNA